MPAYVIADVDVKDTEQYEAYKKLSAASITQYGGHYIARGGNVFPLEGGWDTTRLVLISFPSVEQAQTWYDSPEYTAARQIRQCCANGRLLIVEGLPLE